MASSISVVSRTVCSEGLAANASLQNVFTKFEPNVACQRYVNGGTFTCPFSSYLFLKG